jgi:hypothetical protein
MVLVARLCPDHRQHQLEVVDGVRRLSDGGSLGFIVGQKSTKRFSNQAILRMAIPSDAQEMSNRLGAKSYGSGH